jgi:hypothetical protein
MDKRIYTLLTIYVVFLIISLAMVLSTTAQKTLTMILFGGAGILIWIVWFAIWNATHKTEK